MRGRSGSRPRVRSMSAASSGNVGPATRLIHTPFSAMLRSRCMPLAAATASAAVSAAVSMIATATAARAQAA